MKFIIIGLGNFGTSLADMLTQQGHEVIGVDSSIETIEGIKDRITQAICMDCRHQAVVKNLPLKDADIVIVTIGEDEGANLLTTALMKKIQAKDRGHSNRRYGVKRRRHHGVVWS